MIEKDTIEDRIAKLERELGAIPFPMYRDDSHGPQLKPGETEAELWLRRLEQWLHVQRSDPSLWDKMVRGD